MDDSRLVLPSPPPSTYFKPPIKILPSDVFYALGEQYYTLFMILRGTSPSPPEPVDANTLILIVKELNATNSIGSDGIAFKFLRDALYVIVPLLTCIINTSLVTGVFPESWKHALVVTLYKNGDPDV
ncbi:uncharacterized protein LOC135111811 [Scylla paramamosain]|uniref:uncharacterized protein LOC135111811 n=1 Tax=Scylla paramamosain TaxID=85552 RepID=UPI0030833EE5